MLKKYFFLILSFSLILDLNNVFSQSNTVQWADKVLEVSSEFDSKEGEKRFKAIQALGKPNAMPQGGKSGCAWGSLYNNSKNGDWIKVGFNTPISIQQIGIAENFNPGSIQKIYVYDIYGTEYLIYNNPNLIAPTEKWRMFNVYFQLTPYKVSAVKLELNTRAIEGWNLIDAIGISDSRNPIVAEINEEGANGMGYISQKENLGREINSEYGDILPVISPDSKVLYFARKEHPENMHKSGTTKIKDDIWYSYFSNNRWSRAIRMPSPLNNVSNNFVCSVTPDGNTLLLGNKYNQDGTCSSGVSMSHRTSNGWSFPENLNIANYYNMSDYSEFCLAPNNKVLILAIRRKDSEGDRDLYVSFLQPNNNTWTEPKNMGSLINTPEKEITPFVAADNKTLYFSSSGRSGYGSTDMYITKRLDDTWLNWSEPVNLGKDLNSDKWDASYTIDAFGEYAYFVSRDNSYNESTDIFRVRLPEKVRPNPVVIVTGTVYNAKTKEPIAAEIVYENLKNGEEIGKAISSPMDGRYSITLPLEEFFGFRAQSRGFVSTNDNIDLHRSSYQYSTNSRVITKDLHLTPVEAGQRGRLNNVFFAQGEDRLLPESYYELNRLVNILKENPRMEVVLEGHTDIQGDPNANMKLSEDRVKVIKEYVVTRGIEPNRIGTAAYGATQPLTRNRDAESKKKNRRVEFRITKM